MKSILHSAFIILTFSNLSYSTDNTNGLRKSDLFILSMGNGLDYASTRYALSHCESCSEFNPLAREHLELTKALGLTVQLVLINQLRKNKKHKLADILVVTIGVSLTAIAVSNYHIGRTK